MSNIAIKGATTGTGTFTIESPATNTDRTLTLPDSAGELLLANGDGSNLTNLPSPSPIVFRANRTSAQSLAHNTVTKVQFNSEIVDTDGCYDPTTNYRFTPTTAGYYQLSFSYNINGHLKNWSGTGFIYKNGSRILRIVDGEQSGWDETNFSGTIIVEANGTTDYFEVYAYHFNYTNNGALDLVGTSDGSSFTFQGHFLRGL